MVTLRTSAEIAQLREAGRVVAEALRRMADAVVPGATPLELDEVGARCLKEHRAKSSFQHYHPRFAPTPYPAVACISVNDVVVHGIPDGRPFEAGDIVSIDFGAELGGYHGDAAVTVVLPGGDDEAARRTLSDTTRDALEAAIAVARPGARLGDIGHAVEQVGRGAGYGILENNGGHGVGQAMHEDPHVPNTGRAGRGLRLREGLVIAIEPMFTAGGRDGYRVLPDGWSMATDDGTAAAHWEHTIAITADGPRVLTAP